MKFPKPFVFGVVLAAGVATIVVLRSGSRHLQTPPSAVQSATPPKASGVIAAKQHSPWAAPARPAIPASLGAFGAWAKKYTEGGPDRSALIVEGEALAKARRAEVKRLMREDPEAALALAVPYSLRKQLPESIQAQLEKPISARGKVEVVQYTPLPGREDEVPPTFYRTTIGQASYVSYFAGPRPSKNANGVGVVGMSVDEVLVNSGPRIIEGEEARDIIATNQAANPSHAQSPAILDVGGEYLIFSSSSQAQSFKSQVVMAAIEMESATLEESALAAGAELPIRVDSSTKGTKKLLVIPVAYADDPRAPQSQDGLVNGARANERYFKEGSYGAVSFVTTITPLMTLPERKIYYGEYLGAVLPDAVAAAGAAGYNAAEYGYIYAVFNPLPQVTFGGRSDGLLSGGIGAISHELGHNFGLGHASYWDVNGDRPGPTNTFGYPFDRDSIIGHYDVNAPFRFVGKIPVEQYGNPFDVMGSGGGHFSASAKHGMDWLPEKMIRVIPTFSPNSDTNRIYAFDTPHVTPDRLYALSIRKNANASFPEVEIGDGRFRRGRQWWVSYRQGFPNNPWLSSGVQVTWDGAEGGGNNKLLDTTGNTSGGKNDSGVVIGRTFVDSEIPLYLTPVAQGGGPDPSDKWIDVVANIGVFPGNVPPVMSLAASALNVPPGDTVEFTVNASDDNGDVLAYHWDFGDGSFGYNTPVNTKSFPSAGQYVVRCDVSDMKGGKASGYVVVRVGAPDTFAVTGRVVDLNGNPVQGVRVHNGGTPVSNATPAPIGYPAAPPPTNSGSYLYSYTDSQGFFTIGNMPAGTNTFGAFLYGYKIDPLDFANPVRLQDGDIQGLNFIATAISKLRITPSEDAFEPSTAPGVFTITRDGDVSEELPLRFAIGGIAINGTDYEQIGSMRTNIVYETNETGITTNYIVVVDRLIGDAVIPAGEVSTSVLITPIDNSLQDGPRSVRLSLILATNYFRYTTTLTNVITTNGTVRTTNTLFLTKTNEITIPGWEAIQTGSDNQFTWFQSYPTYILDSPSEAMLNILDDEEPVFPSVSIAVLDSAASESHNDCAGVTFVREGAFDSDLRVYYAISGTASNGMDYVLLPGAITIPAGQKFINLPVIPLDDLFVENDETISILVLDDPDGNYLAGANSSATVAIQDDDLPLLNIYASDSTANKSGNNGRVTIVRAGDISRELLVNYLVTGSALDGIDYNTLSGSVVIPAGATSADVPIVPIGTSPSIGSRTVTVVLSDSEAYNIDGINKATVTIQDNLPVVTLEVTTAAAAEGGAGGLFTVRRTGSVSNGLTVAFAVGGSAVEVSDYGAIGSNVTFAAGSATATIAIAPIQDRFKERGDITGLDTVILRLLEGTNYVLGATTAGTVTISDDDDADLPVVTFMKRTSSGREDSGAAVMAVRVSANPATNKPVIVTYRITSGSAVNGVNYDFTGTGRLDFTHFFPLDPPDDFVNPEGGIQLINIPLLDDRVAAGDKNFTITLFNFTGYTTNVSYVTNNGVTLSNVVITPIPTNQYLGEIRSHTFTILDIGTTIVNIEAPTPVAYEEGAVPGTFRIWREGPTNKALTVNLGISGTASGGSDYVALPFSVTIPAGTNQVIVPVVPLDDPQEEFAETVIVSLIDGAGFVTGADTAVAIIVDNDGTIQFTQANYEVDEGVGEAVIDVVRTGHTNRASTVDYELIDGSAIYGLDYLPPQTTGTLSFAVGETLQQIRIPIISDSVVEPRETISLVLTNPTGGVPLGGQRLATLAINDDDISFQFVTNAFQVDENGVFAFIYIERLGLLTPSASVVFHAMPGGAQDQDFQITDLPLTFDPGEKTKPVFLPIFDDESFEGNEQVNLLLTEPSSNAAVGPASSATLTIVDDECAIEFASVNFSTNEYAASAAVVVRRAGGTVNAVSVNYQTIDGSANSIDPVNFDYYSQSGTINFAGDQYVLSSSGTGELIFQPGESNKTILIQLADDVLGEGNETFQVVLSDLVGSFDSLPGATVYGAVTNATVTIVDNETPGQIDYEFGGGPGANDTVFAVALQPDASVVFGGQFTRVNNIVYNRIARLHPDGTLDVSFNPGAGVDGTVLAVASQSDGKVLLGGLFNSVDSTNRFNLARLNANGNLDLGFDPGAGPDNAVRAVAVQTDGMVIAGGDFTTVNGVARSYLARFRPNGSLDTNFTTTVDSPVYGIAVQPDGRILLAGGFTRVGGAVRRYIARLNADGGLDTQFTTGAGPNNPVNAVAAADDGKVVIGGLFTSVDSQSRNFVARLNANGSVDLGFDPGFGANATVTAIGTQPGGKVVIGGDFTFVDNQPRNRYARLRPTGALDITFNIGSGADSTVNALAIQPNTAIVIGGAFTNVNGVARNRIARIHGDDRYSPTSIQFDQSSYVVTEDSGSASIRVARTGNTNSSFSATFMTVDGSAVVDRDYSTNSTVLTFVSGEVEKIVPVTILNDLELELDETVILLLTNAPSSVDINSPSAQLIIRDDEQSVQFALTDYAAAESSNAVLTVIRSGPATSELTVSYSTIPGTALAITDFVAASNQLAFAANQATQSVVIELVNDRRKEFLETFDVILSNPSGPAQIGNNSRATVSIIDDDFGPGSIDLSFTPGTGLNGFVKSAVVQEDGKVVMGGSFTDVNGVSRNRIARLGTNGAVDLSFDPGLGANALVTSLALQSNGKIAVAGAFTQLNGTNRNRAAWLLSDGRLDGSLSGSNGINAAAHSILPLPANKVLLGGAFTLPVSRIGRLRSDATIDTTFFAGFGPNGSIYSMARQADGKILVVGDFTTFDNSARSRVARLAADGTLDFTFVTGPVVTGAVQCVLIQPDGNILIGGDFIRVNGIERGHVARLLTDGSVDSSFSGLGADGSVYSMALQLDGKILIGGSFTSVGGVIRYRIARLNTDGTLDLTFDPGTGTDGPVYVVALAPDEHVIIGGDFTRFNGFLRRGIARLSPDDPIDIAFLPGTSLANGAIQMSINAKPGHPYALEASSDLTQWTILRTNMAPGTTLSFTETNVTSFNNRFYRVRQVVP